MMQTVLVMVRKYSKVPGFIVQRRQSVLRFWVDSYLAKQVKNTDRSVLFFFHVLTDHDTAVLY